jgi:hypothetical protein
MGMKIAPAICCLCYVPHGGQGGQLLLLQWYPWQDTCVDHHQIVPASSSTWTLLFK